MQRQSDDRSSSRTTVRLLESLVRLTCAHAKLMFRKVATLQDAVVAIACVAASQAQLQSHSSLSSSSAGTFNFLGLGSSSSSSSSPSFLHYDFPDHPDEDYITLENQIFSALHCTRESLLGEDVGQGPTSHPVLRSEALSTSYHNNSTPVDERHIRERETSHPLESNRHSGNRRLLSSSGIPKFISRDESNLDEILDLGLEGLKRIRRDVLKMDTSENNSKSIDEKLHIISCANAVSGDGVHIGREGGNRAIFTAEDAVSSKLRVDLPFMQTVIAPVVLVEDDW